MVLNTADYAHRLSFPHRTICFSPDNTFNNLTRAFSIKIAEIILKKTVKVQFIFHFPLKFDRKLQL